MPQVNKAICITLWAFTSAALAGEGWQNRPSVCDTSTGIAAEQCHTWVQTVRRPDYRAASCCGEGDAFIADDFLIEGNKFYAIITGGYEYPPPDVDDPPASNEFRVERGMRVEIPPEKVNRELEDRNRSGHGVVFMSPANGTVYCYFFPPLT